MTGAVRAVAMCVVGLLIVAALGKLTSGQGFPKPTLQEGPVEVRGNVNVTNSPTVDARQAGLWSVSLDEQTRVHVATPSFVQMDRTYNFRWSEADRWERYRVTNIIGDGWVIAEAQFPGAAHPQQYLNVARAVAVVRVQ